MNIDEIFNSTTDQVLENLRNLQFDYDGNTIPISTLRDRIRNLKTKTISEVFDWSLIAATALLLLIAMTTTIYLCTTRCGYKSIPRSAPEQPIQMEVLKDQARDPVSPTSTSVTFRRT